ncbi:MAG TPA: hypothetical protein VFO99_17275 [Pyrinomonadaceae bacterium]|nr:hypothetical protein [Pyrinomonadaceae bacterium]
MSAGTKATQMQAHNPPQPNSRRVYVDGKLPGVRVPFREITQSPSRIRGTGICRQVKRKFREYKPKGLT